MTILVIVGVAFILFCIVAVLVITAIAQPPNKAVDYYLEKRAGGRGESSKRKQDATTVTVESPGPKPPESPKS